MYEKQTVYTFCCKMTQTYISARFDQKGTSHTVRPELLCAWSVQMVLCGLHDRHGDEFRWCPWERLCCGVQRWCMNWMVSSSWVLLPIQYSLITNDLLDGVTTMMMRMTMMMIFFVIVWINTAQLLKLQMVLMAVRMAVHSTGNDYKLKISSTGGIADPVLLSSPCSFPQELPGPDLAAQQMEMRS